MSGMRWIRITELMSRVVWTVNLPLDSLCSREPTRARIHSRLQFQGSHWRWLGLAIVGLACLSTVGLPTLATAADSAPSGPTADDVSMIDLPTALRLAGAQNLDVRIARERLAEAEAADQSARLQFFPWLSPGITYRRHENRIQDVVGNILDADKQSYAPGATVAAQVDLGEAIYKKLAAKQLMVAAQHALESQRQDATLAAASGYFDLTKTHAFIAVTREALRISQEYQRQLHEAVAAGIAFKGDELRVQVQSERQQIALRQALEQQRTAAARLAQTLHLDPAIELIPRDAEPLPLTLFATNVAMDVLVRQALIRRPELKQNEAAIAAAQNNRQGAKYGPLVPSISAQAFAGGLGGGRGSSLDNFGPSEDYAVVVGWRIGPGGLFDSSRIQAAEARLSSARLSGEKLRDQIIHQVVDGWTRAQSLADQLSAARKNVQTTTDTLKLTEQRREFAVGAVLEVIQAQQEVTRARLDYINIVAEYNKAQYALSRAAGGTTLDNK